MTDEDEVKTERGPQSLLRSPPRVINVGLARFAEDLAVQGAPVQHVHWSPPAGGDAVLADLLSKLDG
jgi:FdrA protein